MNTYPLKKRHRLYREHKYLLCLFSTLLQKVATHDFGGLAPIDFIKNDLQQFSDVLHGHAHYEESRIHTLLAQYDSKVAHLADQQHQAHHLSFAEIFERLEVLAQATDREERLDLGYKLYLDLRRVFADMLSHFNYEEQMILPELQTLLSDMKDCVPDKFAIAWPMLKKLLNIDEAEYCEVALAMHTV